MPKTTTDGNKIDLDELRCRMTDFKDGCDAISQKFNSISHIKTNFVGDLTKKLDDYADKVNTDLYIENQNLRQMLNIHTDTLAKSDEIETALKSAESLIEPTTADVDTTCEKRESVGAEVTQVTVTDTTRASNGFTIDNLLSKAKTDIKRRIEKQSRSKPYPNFHHFLCYSQ